MSNRREVVYLAVSVSVVLALTLIVALMVRYAGLKVLHAILCVFLGFYLASSSLSGPIANLTGSLIGLISGR